MILMKQNSVTIFRNKENPSTKIESLQNRKESCAILTMFNISEY